MKPLVSRSSRQTAAWAGKLAARLLGQPPPKRVAVVALVGELGSGKTVFVKGFLKRAGIRRRITSPTFLLMRSYFLRHRFYRNVYHLDCFRIKKPAELLRLGLKQILTEPKNIVLVEWADKIKRFLPKNTLWIKLEHGRKENERIIKIK